MIKSPSPFSLRRIGITGFAFLAIMLMLVGFVIPAKAATLFPVSPPVTITTSADKLVSNLGASCSFQSFIYVFYYDTTAKEVYVSSSQTGNIFSSPQPVLSLGFVATTDFSVPLQPVMISCTGNVVIAAWSNIGKQNGTTTTNYIRYTLGTLSNGGVTFNAISLGPVSKNGFKIHSSGLNNAYIEVTSARYLNGIAFVSYIDQGTSAPQSLEYNNVNVANDSGWNSLGDFPDLAFNGNSYIWTNGCSFVISADGKTWSNTLTSISPCSGSSNDNVVGITASATVAQDNFLVAYDNSGAAEIDLITSAGSQSSSSINSGLCSHTTSALILTTDDISNLVAICWHFGSTGTYWTSGDLGTTWSAAQSFSAIGALVTGGAGAASMGIPQYFDPSLNAFAVTSYTSTSTFTVYATLFGVPISSSVPGAFTLGSCPIKDTSTLTLTNNTVYYYTGTAISSSTVNTISTFLASTSAPTATQLLYTALYATSGPGAVSVSNPLNLISQHVYFITPGMKNQLLTYAVNTGGTGLINSGATVAVAVEGTSKLTINDSGLSGLYTSTFAVSFPPAMIQQLGTSSGSTAYLCANGNYQFVVTTTIISTCTTSILTTTTVGTGTFISTITSTATSVDVNIATATTTGYALLFIMIIIPAGILAFAMGYLTKSGSAAGIGGVAGLLVGTGLAARAGLAPFYLIVVVILACVMILVGVWRNSSNG